MADPTVQTFCCYTANITETTQTIMEEFNTSAYNAVCMFSSTAGILGAIYQILPRQQFSRNHRWLSFSAARGRKIVLWLAVADLLASLGVLIRATLWLRYKNIMPATDDTCSVIFCALSSAWIQYFYIATWVWTLCYAIDMRFVLKQREEKVLYYHIAAWAIPAILTAVGLSLLYFPDANCHTARTLADLILRILPNYFATYIPIAVVMIVNPCLYLHSSKDMEKIITCSSGQFTKRERDLIEAVKIKFCSITVVFFFCWTPNILNGVLLWATWLQLPVTLVITLWYLMAFTNPLQALLNCLVYRRWNSECEMVLFPWSNKNSHSELSESKSYVCSTRIDNEEHVPLLQQFRRPSSGTFRDYT